MLSALSTVPPPTLFVNLLFLQVSTCRWVCFLVLLHLGETRDNYSTLMPFHILSFGWAFSSRLSLVLCGHLAMRPSLSFQLGVAASALFFYLCIYIYGPRSFWGLDGFTYGPHLPFSEPHTLTRLCFDSPLSLKYLAVALSLSLSRWYNTITRYSLSRV